MKIKIKSNQISIVKYDYLLELITGSYTNKHTVWLLLFIAYYSGMRKVHSNWWLTDHGVEVWWVSATLIKITGIIIHEYAYHSYSQTFHNSYKLT
jgi:hypothetical protein